MISFWRRAQATPPILVRLLARKPHSEPLTDEEIAAASRIPGFEHGLSTQEVQMLSWKTCWRGVDIPTMRAFLTGCGVDFCNVQQMKRIDIYMRWARTTTRREATFKYLRTSPLWLSKYHPMILRWRESCLNAPPQSHD